MGNTFTVHDATIIAQEALMQLRQNIVMAKRVRRDYDSEVAQYGSAVKIPKFAALSANTKTGGSNVTVQDLTSDSVTCTLNKQKEATFIIEDIEKALSRNDLLAGYMTSAMIALSEQVESDIIALYSGLSQSVGTYGTDLTRDIVLSARKKLTDGKAPTANRTLLVSTKDLNALLSADTALMTQFQVTGSAQQKEEGIIGRLYGFDVMESQLVPLDMTTHTHNIAFHQDAFALVVRPLPVDFPSNLGVVAAIAQDPVSGLALRTILTYNKDRLGVQCTVDILYGVVELRDELGVEVKA